MKNLILTGWGWKDYACAAALALRKYPDSDVLGMSTRRLPEFLDEVNGYQQIILLGIGLTGNPELLLKALTRLHSQGVQLHWLSALPFPESLSEEIRSKLDVFVMEADTLTIKGDIPLERMIRAVQNFQTNPEGGHDRPRMNLLLSGPPGSGKTEFVKYLSQKLNTKLIIRMGSDILSKYVGEIEQNIRQAFADANAEHAILFLDEIDGLVQSREQAQRSWEVSKVNELLYQMEHFSGVMIGATNFASSLDAAILRRFTFKVEFDFLSESGKVLFFEHMFQTSLSDAEKKRLTEIPCLAPGDFRTVRQSLFYLGGETSNAERLFALEQESRAKTQNRFARRQKIGF